MEYKSLCHICLRTDREPRVLDDTLSEFIDDISDFAIALSDELPLSCSECEHSLRQFYVFRQKCVEAIKILQQWKKTKQANRKPINTLRTLLLKADSLKQDTNRVYDVDATHSKPEGKPNCAFKSEILKIESIIANNHSLLQGGNETNSKYKTQASVHPLIEQMKIKLESDDENDDKGTETLEYDARNSTTYVYEETAVKIENDDRSEHVNRDNFVDSTNNEVSVAENDLNNSNARHLSDTSLNSQDDITDSDVDEVEQQETSRQDYSDTSLNSDDDISDSEVFGEGRRKKIKMKKKSLLQLTNIEISSDNDTDVDKAAKKRVKIVKKPLCVESLKQKLSSIFEHCKEVKSTDGTVVERDVVINNLVNLNTKTMKQLYNYIKSSETEFTPKALDFLGMCQKRFENKYDAIFDIEYLNTEEQVLAEFARRKTYECYVAAPFKCELCHLGFQYANMLDYHRKMHHDPSVGDYICAVCKVRNSTKKLHLSHAQRKHRTVLTCKLCPLVTYVKSAMIRHAKNHQGLVYKCSRCSNQFKSSSAMKSHEMRSHVNEHICRFCARTFTRQHGLFMHRKLKHRDNVFPEGEGVPCDTCNITFISSQVYERHRRITHSEGGKRRRRAYPKRKPGGPKRLYCPACPAHGTNPYWLAQHLRAAHPERPPATPAHLCDVCGKGFATNCAVEQHRNVHTGARPYACDKCPAKFHTASSLTAHKSRHGPKRQCKVCGKSGFSSTTNLAAHMRTHIGDRRYKCDICPAAFLHSGSLKEHVRGVHLQQRRVRSARRAPPTTPTVTE